MTIFYRDELGQYYDIYNMYTSTDSAPSSGTYYRLNLNTGIAIDGYSINTIQNNNYIG